MRDGKTYFLDLQTLLTYLSTQSCELITKLTIAGETARGSITLKEGRIVDCVLFLPDGSQILGENAYRQLQTSTEWQVELIRPEEKKTIPPPQQFSSQRSSLPPLSAQYGNSPGSLPLRQKRPLQFALLGHLSPKERFIMRSVFAMINGKRSCEEIKRLLHLSPQEIDDALARLRYLDAIE